MQEVSTIELIKAGWPIIAALLTAFASLVAMKISVENLKEIVKNLREKEIEKIRTDIVALEIQAEADLNAFKTKVQNDGREFMLMLEKTRMEFTNAVEKTRSAQLESERRLEDKLDRLDNKTDSALAKIYDRVNETNNILAEIKGQLKMREKQST